MSMAVCSAPRPCRALPMASKPDPNGHTVGEVPFRHSKRLPITIPKTVPIPHSHYKTFYGPAFYENKNAE